MDSTWLGESGWSPTVNVSRPERIASALAGGSLLYYGLRRGSWSGLAMAVAGGGLLARGATGHCPMYRAAGHDTAGDTRRALGGSGGVLVDEAVTIDVPVDEVFRFWRNFENLPRFMKHLESVKMMDDTRSHWVVKAPAGATVEWDAEVINEVPDQVIAWRSLANADVTSAGSVNFSETPGGRGTEVRVRLQYDPPAGKLGAAVATLFGEEPSQQIADDLQRLKEMLESRAASRQELHRTM
jgi:uncharacterized membrane protein